MPQKPVAFVQNGYLTKIYLQGGQVKIDNCMTDNSLEQLGSLVMVFT
jgi:hypothetical protein